MVTEHTPECLEIQRIDKIYQVQWPDHCTFCRGTGVVVEMDDPSPSGVGLSPGYYTYVETCDDCVAIGKCPRCGKIGLTTGEQIEEGEQCQEAGVGPCTFCTWDYQQGGRPFDGCCDCWFMMGLYQGEE